MVLIETDILVALIVPTEKHHREAIEIIRTIKPLTLSPYALIELDLLILAKRISVKDVDTLYKKLAELLELYRIEVPPPTPLHLAIAHRLRSRYGMTYFDSLHAAIAITRQEVLASYDRSYSKIEEVRWIHPSQLLTKS